MSESTGRSEPTYQMLRTFADRTLGPDDLSRRLAALDDGGAVPGACARLVDLLTGIQMEENPAREHMHRIAAHWARLRAALGRDPGLPLAVFDYFINVERLLEAPRMIEISRYREIERLAETDPLTGLANRRCFEEAARTELRRAERYGLKASILFLDLDDFKETNDRWGHPFGDRILAEVARLIGGAVREVDLAARHGGEEFAVLLPETPKDGALAVTERIRRRIEERFAGGEVEGRRLRITISGGVTTFPEDGHRLEDLLRRADEALYAAKALGKNRIMPAREDRRRSLRLELPPGTLRPVMRLAGEPGNGRRGSARNISRCGVLLESERPLPVGAEVDLLFEPDDGFDAPLAVSGRVVRRQDRHGGDPGACEIGIDFDPSAGETCERLERGLQRRLAAEGRGAGADRIR